MSATCPVCGKPVRIGAKFCSTCGAEMPATIPLSQVETPQPDAESSSGHVHDASESPPPEPLAPEVQPPSASSVPCPHCGKTIRAEAKFCNFCGKPTALAETRPEPAAQKASVPAAPPPPVAIPPAQPPAGTKPPKKKGGKKGWLVFLILLLVFLCALAATAFLALRGTFGDLQLPEPLEELSSRLQSPTPTSEPTRTPKPTKTPTATDTPEPTFTPTKTLAPTRTATPEPEYTFYDSFETGLNNGWVVLSISPDTVEAGKVKLRNYPPIESGITSSLIPALEPGMEISVLASLYEGESDDILQLSWRLDKVTDNLANPLSSPAAIQASIGYDSQTLKIYDSPMLAEIGTCSVSKTIDNDFHSYTIKRDVERIGLYMDGVELCYVNAIPADLDEEGYLHLTGNAILDEVYIIDK